MTHIRGWQIAFLIFALVFLCAPVNKWVVPLLDLAAPTRALVERTLHLFVLAIIVVGVPGLRRAAIGLLRIPTPKIATPEAVAVTAFNPLLHFAAFGGIAAWLFVTSGPNGLERMMANAAPVGDEWAKALSMHGVLFSVVIAGFIGPVIEEVVFRGFLQGAWERRWGWLTAVLMTSAIFGLFHPHPAAAFVAGVVYSCLYRRTGSLRASIACHMVGNLLLWYPLLGQFLLPPRSMAMGDPMTWSLHLTCLLGAAILVPAYVFIAGARPAGELPCTEVLHQPA